MAKKKRKPAKRRSQKIPLAIREAATKALQQAPFVDGARLSDGEEPLAADFSEIKDIKRRLFLQGLARTNRIDFACRAANICGATSWHWRKDHSDPVWQAALERAMTIGIERWESELARRGFEGVKKPIYQQGRLIGTVREYDTTAAIFMLKGAKPEKYRERFEHSGPGGSPIQVQSQVAIMQMPDDQLLAKIQAAADGLRARPVAALPAPIDVTPAKPEMSPEAQAYAVELAKRSGNGKG